HERHPGDAPSPATNATPRRAAKAKPATRRLSRTTDSAAAPARWRLARSTVMPSTVLADRATRWYATAARDLPWRRPGTAAWGVLTSEFMLQQPPAARVEPVYLEWMRRWPAPVDLAAEPAGEAIRVWGRLGYPRRALRLHA